MGLLWLLAFCLFWLLQPFAVGVFDGAAASAVAIALSAALWLFTPWLLVARRIHWRGLLPQAPLTSIGISAFALASGLYMPRAVGAAARDFGFIGVAFSLLSWLFVVSVILVVSAALGAVLADPARAGESARAVDRRDR